MNSKTIQHALLLSLLLLPVVSLAQFKPLVGIPGISDPSTDINTYINVLYALSISVAALLAVIKIIIAGVKYMLSDLISSKQEAKSDIQGALIGLLVVISAVLILNVINPQLTQSTLFLAPVDQVPFNNSALGGGGGGGTPAPLVPAPSKENCTFDSVTQQFNCAAANSACIAKGGKPTQSTNFFGSPKNNEVSCSYGTNITISCKAILTSDPSDPNPTYSYECSDAIAQCTDKKGTATIIGSSNETVSCAIKN